MENILFNSRKSNWYIKVLLFLFFTIFIPYGVTFAEPNEVVQTKDIYDMDIEELLNIEVSVVSKKSESHLEAPGVVSVVPREEIDIYGDRNLHQLLQRQPSIYTRNSFVYSDNLAAFRGDMSTHAEMHTLILFNGRPIRESAQGHNLNMYMTFPLTSLDSVELIRGPGSVLYGSNAFTGVINLKSRPIPETPEFTISSMTGSYGYYDTIVSGGYRTGDFGFVTDARTVGTQGHPYRLFDDNGVYGSDNQKYKSISATTHIEYQNFTVDIFGSDIDAFAMGVSPTWSNPHHNIRNKKLFINVGHHVPVNEKTHLELNLTYNLQENFLSRPQYQQVGTNTSDVLGEVTLFTNPIDNLNIVGGYLQEYRRNYDPDNEYYQSIPSYNQEPESLYAQGDYKIGKSAKLIAGIQWNESPLGDSDTISRYGIILTPFEKWGLKLLRGEAFRAPVTLESDLYDPPVLVGNKNLKPEIIKTYDAQLFYSGEKTYAAFTYFNSTINRLIIYDASVSPMSYMNGGEQKFDGIEFEAKRFLNSRWHVIGSFMYQNNKADAGINPSVVPDNMGKLGTGYSWDGGSASIFYTYYDTPPTIDSTVIVNPKPSAVSLVSVNVRLDTSELLGMKKGRAILTLRGENLLNEKINVPTFAYTGSPNSFPYGPGIMFFTGLTIHF